MIYFYKIIYEYIKQQANNFTRIKVFRLKATTSAKISMKTLSMKKLMKTPEHLHTWQDIICFNGSNCQAHNYIGLRVFLESTAHLIIYSFWVLEWIKSKMEDREKKQ